MSNYVHSRAKWRRMISSKSPGGSMGWTKTTLLIVAAMLMAAEGAYSQQFRFHLQEATIDDVHQAIRQGQITCRGLVQLYINRAKAYNGVADVLVTRDGAPIPPAPGVMRLGAPLKFPTATV